MHQTFHLSRIPAGDALESGLRISGQDLSPTIPVQPGIKVEDTQTDRVRKTNADSKTSDTKTLHDCFNVLR